MRNLNWRALVVILPMIIGHHAFSSPLDESPESWYQDGQEELKNSLRQIPNFRRAKNVILFLGDGMGVSTVTASRIYEGQQRGESGEDNSLSFEKLPNLALSKTYNTNQQTPDSAGTMSAIMTGVKTKAGVIAVNQYAQRGDCGSTIGNELTTFLEQAEDAGLSTGVVTTTRLTHATPAATYAHSADRDWEDDKDMPAEALAAGCKDIASQLIDFQHGNGLEVAMGGGRRSFLPNTVPDAEDGRVGERQDGRNLIQEWIDQYDDSAYVWNRDQLLNINPNHTDHLLGLFENSHMQYETDREGDVAGEPSLTEMTEKAIQVLQKNRRGYFLVVESGRIDHAHHVNNAQRALEDTKQLSAAVESVLDKVDLKDTLVIVTADHSHVFTMAGYPKRGNPILGKVVGVDDAGNPNADPELALDDLPYTTVGYSNGLGYAEGVGGDLRYRLPEDPGRHDMTFVDTEDHDFHQEVLVPLGPETHGGEDVAIYAGGPWSHLFSKTYEQNYIYHVMQHAAKLENRKQRRRPWWKR